MHQKPLSPQDESAVKQLVEEIRNLRLEKKFDEAEAAGETALKRYPSSLDLLSEHADTAVRRKTWGPAIKRLERLISRLEPSGERDATVLKLVAVCLVLGQPGEAETYLADALASRPASLTLRKAMAETTLLRPGAATDPTSWRLLAAAPELATADDADRIPLIAACVTGLRLAGQADEARLLLDAHYEPENPLWTSLLKDGFGRLVVFENGRTRVEFLTRLFDPATLTTMEPSRLAITFDVMEQTWDKESFAYRPLSQRSIDILAVRKRTKDDFHQDFRREDFLRVAAPVAAAYRDVVSLGQSLGAYCALYYASWLPGCRILATAPRNPLNPKYANRRYASYRLFLHEYDMQGNPDSSPTIVYDPKNSEDARYVGNCLGVRFPNARLVEYPYCGHSITRYLRDVGLLKNATLGFCEGLPFPEFDRSLRGESAEYLRNIAKLNLLAGRRSWARALAQQALALGADEDRSRVLLATIDPPAAAG